MLVGQKQVLSLKSPLQSNGFRCQKTRLILFPQRSVCPWGPWIGVGYPASNFNRVQRVTF